MPLAARVIVFNVCALTLLHATITTDIIIVTPNDNARRKWYLLLIIVIDICTYVWMIAITPLLAEYALVLGANYPQNLQILCLTSDKLHLYLPKTY